MCKLDKLWVNPVYSKKTSTSLYAIVVRSQGLCENFTNEGEKPPNDFYSWLKIAWE